MRLLVSVRNETEAIAAVQGGADFVDAKEPQAGALGPVTLPTFAAIVRAVAGAAPVTAALGDAGDPLALERQAAAFRSAGAAMVKIGFAGVRDGERLQQLLSAARRGAGADRVIAVAYADHIPADAPAVETIIAAAARAGVAGVLVDTADKSGAGLTGIAPGVTTRWVRVAHDARLLVALAGKLTAADVQLVRQAGADVCGVRGAVCDGGRFGAVSADRVRTVRLCCRPPAAPAPAAPDRPAPRSA